jgi:hypothetical protein
MTNLLYYLTNRGFFSEIYQLINVIIYCEENNFNLNVCDKNWTYSIKNGLKDYFIFNDYPCINGKILSIKKINSFSKFKEHYYIFLFKTNLKHGYISFIFYLCILVTSGLKRNDDSLEIFGHIFSYSSWETHWTKITTIYNNKKKVKYKGDFIEVTELKKRLAKRLWNFNDKTNSLINNNIKKIKLPESYIGIHIRKGDKVLLETEDIQLNKYFSIVNSIGISHVFISTDDYSIIKIIKQQYPELIIYHLVDEKMNGHFQNKFNLQSKNKIFNDTILLLSEVEILRRSYYYIGTISSNITKYLALLRNDSSKTYSLDRRDENIFEDLITNV